MAFSEEDEFALLTKLMGTATHIIGLEQRPIVKGDYIVPDFFLNLKMGNTVNNKSVKNFAGYRCLMEVKTTKKDRFKIGGNRLQRLRNISDLMNYPLFFAVRFLRFEQNALWAIVEDARKSSSLSISYLDVIDGVRNVIWNEYILTPSPKMILKCEFSKSASIDSIRHFEYGKQVRVTYTDGLNTLTQEGSQALLTCGLLETYNLEEYKVEEIDKDITYQYLKPNLISAFLGDIVYKMNNLVVDGFGNVVFDATKLLVRSDTGAHDHLVDRQLIEVLAKPLLDKELMFRGAIGNIDRQLNVWEKFGGK